MHDFKVKKTVILTIVTLLLAADAALAYYNSRIASRAEDPEVVVKAQTLQLSFIKDDVARASRIKAERPDVEKYLNEFETSLPPLGQGYSVVSQELDDIARETHVQVQDTKFHQKEMGGRNLDEIEIESTLNGDYAGIVRFLNRLQRSRNAYVVDSLGLDSEKGAGQANQTPSGMIKLSLRLRSYFRKV